MPDSEAGIWEWINLRSRPFGDRSFAVIEWINPSIFGIKKSSACKLYGSYMALRMALTAARIPFEDVKPQVWQPTLGIAVKQKATGWENVVAKRGKNAGLLVTKKTGGETTQDFKNRMMLRAVELFPKFENDITLATADALLIAEFCRRLRTIT